MYKSNRTRAKHT